METLILLDAPAQHPKKHELAWWKLRTLWKSSPNGRARAARPQSLGRRLMSSGSILVLMVVDQLRDVAKFLIATVLRDPGQLTAKTDEMGIPLSLASGRTAVRQYAASLQHSPAQLSQRALPPGAR